MQEQDIIRLNWQGTTPPVSNRAAIGILRAEFKKQAHCRYPGHGHEGDKVHTSMQSHVMPPPREGRGEA